MSDKYSRLQSLWRNPERDLVGENVEDTLVDLSAYALILVCLQRGNNDKLEVNHTEE